MLFSPTGTTETVAHYQLPQYQIPQTGAGDNTSLFDTAVKALVITGLVTAGVAVLHDLVDALERDLKKESARAKSSRKRKRRLQEA